MIRLLKKCLVLSVGLHLLVLAALVLWAIFKLAKDDKLPPQLTMIAPEVLENILNPQPAATRPVVQPPLVQPTPPQPRPKQQVQPRPPQPRPKPNINPRPPRSAPKPKAQKKTNPQPKPKPTKRPKIKISSKTKVNNSSSSSRPNPVNTKPRTPAVSNSQINNIKGMREQLSAAIQVNVTGANRAAFANYASFVVAVYRRTWQPLIPNSVNRSSIAKVSVTIRRDGQLVSARIIRRTGNAALDRSVQRALDRVKTIGRSFPAGATDAQRTFTLDFTPQIRGGN